MNTSLRLPRWALWLSSGALLAVAFPFNRAQAQPCLDSYTFTASPPPVNGTYGCGETVTFCFTVNTWNTTNANWLQGVVASFGPGWDMNTLVPGTPPGTVGTSGGTWGWYLTDTGTSGVGVGTVGPGFFFDLDNDGIPGNNFGDYATAGPWTFCWTISVASGVDCVNGADLSVTVNTFGDSETGSWGSAGCNGDPDPVLPAVVSACPTAGIGAPLQLCSTGAMIDLYTTLGGTPDPSGTWAAPDGTASTGIIDPSIAASGDYTYTVTPGNNCPTTTATVPVTINAPANAGTNGALSLCETEPITDLFNSLGGTPDVGGTWTDPAGLASTGAVDPAVAGNGVFTYTVSGITPCPDVSATVTLTIDHLPDPGVDAVLALCPEANPVDMFTLLGNQAAPNGVWTDPNGATTNANFDPGADAAGVYTYTVLGTGACIGLLRTAEVSTTIHPSPDAQFTTTPVKGCVPLPVTFHLTNLGTIVSADWSFADGSSGSSAPFAAHTYTTPGTYLPSVLVTDANGCVTTQQSLDPVHAYPPPSAEFTFTPDPPLTTDNTLLDFTALQSGLDYIWNVDGTASTGQEAVHLFPWDQAGEYTICLNVEDSISCSAQNCATILIHDALTVYVPNSFTPDGDGVNDAFAPILRGADDRTLSLQVFDRWGGPVFESHKPDMVWNGGMENANKILPQGVYVWRLVVQNALTAERKEYLGHVTLLK